MAHEPLKGWGAVRRISEEARSRLGGVRVGVGHVADADGLLGVVSWGIFNCPCPTEASKCGTYRMKRSQSNGGDKC